MKHGLSQLEADILVGCVTALADYQQRPAPSGYGESQAKRIAWDAAEGLVRCTPGLWSDVSTDEPAERMRISRTYASLERRGLVERVSLNGRTTTHLRPTDAGKALAATLTATTEQVDG